MLPGEYYQQRLESINAELTLLLKKKTRLAWLRFLAIAGIIMSWYFFIPFGILYVIIPAVLLSLLFARIVFADIRNRSFIGHYSNLSNINKEELKALSFNYYHFDKGEAYIQKEHFYANDLDIFGHASLYQYINRTSSEMGGNTLAAWLLNPAKPEIIEERQPAIKELATKTNWRQELQAFGIAKKIKKETQDRLKNWFAEDDNFLNKKGWVIVSYLAPALLFTIILLNITGVLSNYFRNYFLLASAVLAFYISKKVTPLHQQVSKMADELEVLSDSIQLIEQTDFGSAYLQRLQAEFKQDKGKASLKLSQLKKILERLDLRFNFVVFIPLNVLLQWDLQQVIALEKWKKKNHKNVISWFNALGEFEAVNSLATLAFNQPRWCFPVLKEQHFFISGKEIGHPLIEERKRVNNYIEIEHDGEIMLVTGSNMAGKSTYLRSIGVNVVLAMAGAPVCATQFYLSPVQVISSMRISDNLEESTSTFYAELKKLKIIIDKVNSNEKLFILLDEILRGTNSLDRHTGSEALIRQLIKRNAACIIATHDVELAKMKTQYPLNILNYHFDVQVSNDELYFDYLLKEGICSSLNASILMKKIGIEL